MKTCRTRPASSCPSPGQQVRRRLMRWQGRSGGQFGGPPWRTGRGRAARRVQRMRRSIQSGGASVHSAESTRRTAGPTATPHLQPLRRRGQGRRAARVWVLVRRQRRQRQPRHLHQALQKTWVRRRRRPSGRAASASCLRLGAPSRNTQASGQPALRAHSRQRHPARWQPRPLVHYRPPRRSSLQPRCLMPRLPGPAAAVAARCSRWPMPGLACWPQQCAERRRCRSRWPPCCRSPLPPAARRQSTLLQRQSWCSCCCSRRSMGSMHSTARSSCSRHSGQLGQLASSRLHSSSQLPSRLVSWLCLGRQRCRSLRHGAAGSSCR